jgi:hypothetical protein
MITEQEDELEGLKDSLLELIRKTSEQPRHLSTKHTKILYYKGKKDSTHFHYNISKATGIVRLYDQLLSPSEYLESNFLNKLLDEVVTNKVKFLSLTNKPVPSNLYLKKTINKIWEIRYIDPKIVKIEYTCAIYDNVYLIGNLEGKNIFGLEIYNEDLAKGQKMLFDSLWEKAEPVERK